MTWLAQLLAPIRDLLIGAVVGALVMLALTLTCGDKQMRELRAVGDSIAVASAADHAHLKAVNDSLQRHSDSVAHQRDSLEALASAAARAARALASQLLVAHSGADSLRIYPGLVAALATDTLRLTQALAKSKSETATQRARGDSLQRGLDDANVNIQTLNARIQDTRPAPKWLRIGWHAVAFAGVAWGAYELGQKSR